MKNYNLFTWVSSYNAPGAIHSWLEDPHEKAINQRLAELEKSISEHDIVAKSIKTNLSPHFHRYIRNILKDLLKWHILLASVERLKQTLL